MKKLITALSLGCILAVSAFAQLNVGAHATSNWIPYRSTTPEEGDRLETTAVQVPWGGPDIGAGLSFDGWSEFAGLHLGIDVAYGTSNQTANALSATGSGWVWVKPLPGKYLESLTLYLGNPNNDTLQGKIGGSSLVNYTLDTDYANHSNRIEYTDPQNNIFTKIDPYPWGNADAPTQNTFWPRIAAAAMVTWEPVEHLFIGAFVAPEAFTIANWDAVLGGASWPNTDSVNGEMVLGNHGNNQDYYETKEVYRQIQAQIGYDMPGIGLARVQYIGMRNTVEAAFQVKALGDLVLDIGVKLPFEGTDKEDPSTYKRKKDTQASLAATYRSYDFRLTARVDTAFGASDSHLPGRPIKEAGLDFVAYLIPSYNLSFGTVGADIGFEYEQKDDFNLYTEDSKQAGAALWLQRTLGPAQFRVAAVTRLPLDWNGEKSNFDLFFPISVTVGF